MTVSGRIVNKAEQLEEKIEMLRAETMKFAHVSRDGSIKVGDSEKESIDGLNLQITDVEGKIAKARKASIEITAALKKEGVNTFEDLMELGKNTHEIVTSGPAEAWLAFKLFRGEGKYDNTDRTSWLPGDLANHPLYKDQEDEIRRRMEAARVKEDRLRQTRDHVLELLKTIEEIPVT